MATLSDDEKISQLNALFAAHGWTVTEKSVLPSRLRLMYVARGSDIEPHVSPKSRRSGVWLQDGAYILMECDLEEANERIVMIEMLRNSWRQTRDA